MRFESYFSVANCNNEQGGCIDPGGQKLYEQGAVKVATDSTPNCPHKQSKAKQKKFFTKAQADSLP